MVPIMWNFATNEWEVKDAAGNVLWHAKLYADAAQFAADYIRQSAIQKGLKG